MGETENVLKLATQYRIINANTSEKNNGISTLHIELISTVLIRWRVIEHTVCFQHATIAIGKRLNNSYIVYIEEYCPAQKGFR